MENTQPFIFLLTLEERLPDQYYVFDRLFKELNYILVPVRVDQLQQLVSSTDQSHVPVINSVSNFRQYKLFNDKVRNILKYVLKSRRLSFFELSSFSRLNDSRTHAMTKNYFFIKNPVDARILSEKIVAYHEMKCEKSMVWPGGKRSLANGAA
jgi:hypothetical protein